MYGEDAGQQSLAAWITSECVSPVAQMTAENFHTYEALGLPMLIVFLDVDAGFSSSEDVGRALVGNMAWGPQYQPMKRRTKKEMKNGKKTDPLVNAIAEMAATERRALANAHLLQVLQNVEEIYRNSVTFVYVDGRQYSDHIRTLGIHGGVDALPAAAMNTKDGAQYPLRLPLSAQSLRKCVFFS